MTAEIATDQVRLRSLLLLHGLGAVLVVLIFAIGNYRMDLSDAARHWWVDGFWTVTSFIAATACWSAARHLTRQRRRAWYLFGLGCLSWFVGMLIWDYYELIAGTIAPYPTSSDLFFSLAPVFFIAAFAWLFSGTYTASMTVKAVSDLGIVLTAVVIIYVIILAEPLQNTGISALYKLVAISATILYFSALIFGIVQLARFHSHPGKVPFVLLLISIAVHAFTGTFYSYAMLVEQYQVGHVLDVFWIIAFALTYFAGVIQRGLAVQDNPKLDDELRPVGEFHTIELATYTTTLLVVALVAFFFREQLDTHAVGLVLAAVIVLVLFLSLREWANYRIENRLTREIRVRKVQLERDVAARTEELTLANAALTSARERAELANRSKDEFLANVSHELRTPMNAVLGFADLLAQMPQPAPQRRHLDHIRSAGTVLQRLIDDLLNFSRIDAGALKPQTGPIDLRALIGEIEEEIRAKAAAKGIDLSVWVDPGLPAALELDAVRFRQILSNFLGNAVKYTEAGEIALRLDAEPIGDGAITLSAAVRDTGPGIPEERQTEIFLPFVQLGRSSRTGPGGVGLGLAICQRLAKLMGWQIRFHSRTGEGSTFTLVLPRVRRVERIGGEQGETAAAVPRFRGARILIADDEPWNRDLLRAYLADSDVAAETAENGELALAKVRERRPDLILMDIGMPVMDGLRAIRSLRDSGADSIPVIAVTAAAMGSRSQEAGRLADAVVTKPVTQARLLEAIARFLPHDLCADLGPGPAAVASFSDPQGPKSSDEPDASPASTDEVQLAALLAAEQGFHAAVVSRLHDGPVQDLAALRVELQALSRKGQGTTPAHGDGYDGLAERIGLANRRLRSAMFDLSLDRLLADGLHHALTSLADYLEASFGVVVDFRSEGEWGLSRVAAHILLHALVQRLRDLEERRGIGAAEIQTRRRETEIEIAVIVHPCAAPASEPMPPLSDIARAEHLAAFGITLTEQTTPTTHRLELRGRLP